MLCAALHNTYCSTRSGIVYIAFVVDVFSRFIVGWKASMSMTAPLVIDALNTAAWNRRHQTLDGLVCHNDYAEFCVKPRKCVLTCLGWVA